MKKSGFIFSLLAIVFAIGVAAAPTDFFTNSTMFRISGPGDCSAVFQTVENGCLSTNHGTQCHVNVSQTDQGKSAYDASICTSALRLP